MERPARLALAAVLLFVLIRTEPTVAGMRAVFFGTAYFLGAVVCVALALSIAEMSVLAVATKWRDRIFDPCGVLDFNGEPCMLPDGHADREHATAWVVCSRDGTIEHRQRFDDVATEGREERRRNRAHLPGVTRTGNVEKPAKASA